MNELKINLVSYAIMGVSKVNVNNDKLTQHFYVKNVGTYFYYKYNNDYPYINISFNTIDKQIVDPSKELIKSIEAEAVILINNMLSDILSNPSKCLLVLPEFIDYIKGDIEITFSRRDNCRRSISEVDDWVDKNSLYLNNITPIIERKVK